MSTGVTPQWSWSEMHADRGASGRSLVLLVGERIDERLHATDLWRELELLVVDARLQVRERDVAVPALLRLHQASFRDLRRGTLWLVASAIPPTSHAPHASAPILDPRERRAAERPDRPDVREGGAQRARPDRVDAGQSQHTLESLAKAVEIAERGVLAFILFAVPAKKDAEGSKPGTPKGSVSSRSRHSGPSSATTRS